MLVVVVWAVEESHVGTGDEFKYFCYDQRGQKQTSVIKDLQVLQISEISESGPGLGSNAAMQQCSNPTLEIIS